MGAWQAGPQGPSGRHSIKNLFCKGALGQSQGLRLAFRGPLSFLGQATTPCGRCSSGQDARGQDAGETLSPKWSGVWGVWAGRFTWLS